MAGSANPAMVQGGGPVQQGGMSFVGGPAQNSVPGGAAPSPAQQAPMPSGGGMANPYNQASLAQQASMARVGQGMNQTAAGGMAAYQNPYQQQVIDATLRDIGGAQQMAMNQLGAQATQARAFGGSRHGIAEAEALKGYQQQAMDKVAALRQQGFNTALGASQADLSRQLGAAGQLAGMGQQSFGYGQAIQQQQMAQGAMQQQMMQNLINAAKQQYAGYAGAPQQGLSTFTSAVYGMPNVSGGQKSYQPGVFDYMMAAGQFA